MFALNSFVVALYCRNELKNALLVNVYKTRSPSSVVVNRRPEGPPGCG